MKRLSLAIVLCLLSGAGVSAGPVDHSVVRLANWMVGSFDTRAQAAADRAAGTLYLHDAALMIARPVQDPVVFGDGLYIYLENRLEGETRPYRQRVYRLRKAGGRVRLEVFKIDGRVIEPLWSEPQMLTQLAPGDLSKEAGCDVLLEEKGDEYVGATGSGTCKSTWKGSACVTSEVRVSKDLIVTLDRGFDRSGVQTFGPTDGRGYEFRRTAQ